MCWLQQSAQLWYYPTFLLVPLMVVAAIECFGGYRAWGFLLGLNGAVLGFFGGAVLGAMSGSPALVVVGVLAGAFIGAALLAGIRPLGSFVFAAGSAASLVILVTQVAGMPPRWLMPLVLGAGLAGGVAAVAALRPTVIAMTAVAGAQQIAAAWRAYSAPRGAALSPDVVSSLEASMFLALAATGVCVQLAIGPRAGGVEPRR